jgi:hypothetical protein
VATLVGAIKSLATDNVVTRVQRARRWFTVPWDKLILLRRHFSCLSWAALVIGAVVE